LPEDYKNEQVPKEEKKVEEKKEEKKEEEEESDSESSESEEEEEQEKKKGEVTEYMELDDNYNVFNLKETDVVVYNKDIGVVELKGKDEKEILANVPNEEVNDLGIRKDGTVFIGTKDCIYLINGDDKEKLEYPCKSCCEFAGQVVSVSNIGLVFKDGDDVKKMRKVNSKIEFKNPSKVRASEKHLFVNDIESKVLTIFDEKFHVRKAVNSSKFVDFCVISDTQVGVLFDKGIRVVNFSEKSLFVEKEMKLELNGERFTLNHIEYCKDGEEPAFIGLNSESKKTYKIPLSCFQEPSRKKQNQK